MQIIIPTHIQQTNLTTQSIMSQFLKAQAKWILLVFCSFLLSACVTATPYQQSVNKSYGFWEEQVEANRYKVSFYGNTLTEQQTVSDYALYRAAELTRANGFDYFIVADRTTDVEQVIASRPYYDDFYFPHYYNHRYYGYEPYYAHHHRHFGGYYQYPAGTRYRSTVEIVLFKGQKPANEADAYSADDVLRTVGPRILRPVPKQ